MTAEERLVHAVALAVMAWEVTEGRVGPGEHRAARRADFAVAARERLAQFVQAWALDAASDAADARRAAFHEAAALVDEEAGGCESSSAEMALIDAAKGIRGLR